MILMVTVAQRAAECGARLQQASGEQVLTAQNLLEATTLLRAASYALVIFDQNLIETVPHESATALAHLGGAWSLDINFALTGIDRLVDQVQSALKRRERERTAARSGAVRALHSELNDGLATILLECGAALELPDLPPSAAERFDTIRQAAQKICALLEAGETGQN
jgi:hypothetical protein